MSRSFKCTYCHTENYINDPVDSSKLFKSKFDENGMKEILFLFEHQKPEETFSDCKIISSDKKEYYVHRNILIARSPVFKSMLTCGMEESKSGIIKVKDISSNVINFLLHFIYGNEVLPFAIDPKGSEEGICVSEILYAADKYEIRDLIEHFNVTLGGSFCMEENAIFLLRVANKFQLRNAQVKIRNFVLSKPKLAHAVLEKFK